MPQLNFKRLLVECSTRSFKARGKQTGCDLSISSSMRYKKVQSAITAGEAQGILRCEPVGDNMLDT